MKISLAMRGKGHSHTEEDKMKISIALTGKKKTQEHIHNHRVSVVRSQGVSVNQYTQDGKFVASYPATSFAAESVGVSRASISSCCRGLLKQVKGYVFKYAETTRG